MSNLSRLRSAFLRLAAFVGAYFRLFECAGLVLVFVAGALELTSIRAADRHRAYYEQRVQGQLVLDEVAYRAALQKEAMLLLQSRTARPLREMIVGEKDEIGRLVELASHSLDMYEDVWARAETFNENIRQFRATVGLPESSELAEAQRSIETLKSGTAALRSEMREQRRILKFPLTHLVESEWLATRAREKAVAAAFSTVEELERRRSTRSLVYLALFALGSVFLILGKLGNWLHDNPKRENPRLVGEA